MAGIDGILKTAIKGDRFAICVTPLYSRAKAVLPVQPLPACHIFTVHRENIDIVLLSITHARASNRNFLQRLQNHPLTVRVIFQRVPVKRFY